MTQNKSYNIAIIGGGPAGLIAAEHLSNLGYTPTIYDRKPSVGRKFLMAGRGGLNLTHSEDIETFITRYDHRAKQLAPLIKEFTPEDLRNWCEGLGQKTFIGTSGRVFPEAFKASPLMRAWITRLEAQGVTFKLNHDWQGWNKDGELLFGTQGEQITVTPDVTLLALGGGSWPRLGSDGSWVAHLEKRGVKVRPLQAANCGFTVNWTDIFRKNFAGQPLKAVTSACQDMQSTAEIMITDNGIEGGAIYALSNRIRESINNSGTATLSLDLKPDLTIIEIETRLNKPRRNNSLSNHVRKHLNLSALAFNLLMESAGVEAIRDMSSTQLAKLIKECTLTLNSTFPIDRAISSAGGIDFAELDENYMLSALNGVFVAGEMLDWEAPTGGYLLQACFATGKQAAKGMVNYLVR